LLLHFGSEKAALAGFGVGRLLPGVITPESVHPREATGRRLVRILPDSVPVHVHDREIEKHVDGLRQPGLPDDIPIEIETVGIEKTQGAIEFLEMDGGEQLFSEVFVSVAGMNVNVWPVAAHCAKMVGLAGIEIDKIKRIERRCHP
jgi:hypothetical protein